MAQRRQVGLHEWSGTLTMASRIIRAKALEHHALPVRRQAPRPVFGIDGAGGDVPHLLLHSGNIENRQLCRWPAGQP
jgi:hypothetical protein